MSRQPEYVDGMRNEARWRWTRSVVCILALVVLGPQPTTTAVVPRLLRPPAVPLSRQTDDIDHDAFWHRWGGVHAADPCAHPRRVRARRLCATRDGSSSGVGRGDFNGDGVGDLAIGVPFEDIGNVQDAGAVNVIYGSTSGLTAGGGATGVPVNQFIHQNSPAVPGTAEGGDQLGRALTSGDFDDDGFSDLAIGVPFEDTSNNQVDDGGLVLIVFGLANGLDLTRTQELIEDDGSDQFGLSLAWGDFDDDGVADLAVGAPNRTVDTIDFQTCDFEPPVFLRCTVEPGQGGGVTVFYGERNVGFENPRTDAFRQSNEYMFSSISNEVGDGAEDGDRFGETLAGGDFDNDGVDDLAIGAPGNNMAPISVGGFFTPGTQNAGAVHVVFGDSFGLGLRGSRNSGTEQPYWVLTQDHVEFGNLLGTGSLPGSAETNDIFGAALAVGRRAGRDHLYIGIPLEDLGSASDAGAVLELRNLESSTGLFDAATFWSQDTEGIGGAAESGDMFGFTLASADFNGDGAPDLGVGAPFEDLSVNGSNRVNAGMVHAIYGAGSRLDAANDQVWQQGMPNFGTSEPENNDLFGYSLSAWDFGNGTRGDLAIGVPREGLITLEEVGMVQVLYGAGGGLDLFGNQFWHQDIGGIQDQMEAGDRFGWSAY